MVPQAFPATASVLSPQHLLGRVLTRYALGGPAGCRFFSRGINDTYQVWVGGQGHAAKPQFYLRVYRRGWRTKAEIGAEVDLLLHLQAAGLGVSVPLRRTDGRYLTRIAAPEGERWAVLFSAAPGGRVRMNLRNATSYGALVARTHIEADRMPRDPRRSDLDTEHLVHAPLRHLGEALHHRPNDFMYLQAVGASLGERIDALPATGSPQYGFCHGDHHGGNAHIDERDDLTLFDFDCYGYGWRAYDIAVFRWQLALRFGLTGSGKGRATRRWNAFLGGYESIRELEPGERETVPLFVPIRHIWLMGLHAQGAGVWGYKLVQDTYFDRQIRFIRRWMATMGRGGRGEGWERHEA